MYETFYGLNERPFNLTPDPKFLYRSSQHNEAFAHLAYGLKRRGGFIVVTGEVGTGKTTLCRYFLDKLDDDTISAFVLYPALSTTDLLRSINRDLGTSCDSSSDKELIDVLHAFLLNAKRQGKNVVLVIDEAQNLSRDVLEQVRLISNLETDTEKLIQIVLIGQSELNDLLAQRDLRQLAQRVTARYHIKPLNREEMTHYIRHRLAIAGGIRRVDFTPWALRLIHRFSKGVPRLVNLVCDRSLLAGYVLEKRDLGVQVVRRAVSELNLSHVRTRPWYRRFGLASVSAVLAVVALAAVVVGGLSRAAATNTNTNTNTSLEPASLWSSLNSRVSDTVRENEPPPPTDLQLKLVALSGQGSLRDASAVLLGSWGVPVEDGADGAAALDDVPALAERASLRYEELWMSVEQLRTLNLPAVLELTRNSGHTSDGAGAGAPRMGLVYGALTELTDDTAVLEFGPSDALRVPTSVLVGAWTGRARLFWRDFENLSSADEPRLWAWTERRLDALGLLEQNSDGSTVSAGSSIEPLREGVKALQRLVHLEPTGEVGDETRMALYSLAGGYVMPRLYQP
jgi:general secretion pathway protein A